MKDQQCMNHPSRGAAARCPDCENYYCRECVTEHEGRVICAGCMKQMVGRGGETSSRWTTLVEAAKVVAGLVAGWLFFYMVAQFFIDFSTPTPGELPI